jgi:hypothetical protein
MPQTPFAATPALDVADIPRDTSTADRAEPLEWDFWNERIDFDDQPSFDSWTAFGYL